MHKEWNDHCGEVLDSKNGFDVIECKKCQFKHIIPIPTENELEEVYEDQYYSDEKPLYIERMNEDLTWWNLTYDDRYEFFEKELGKESRSILDVGSGPGLFLKRGQERKWEVTGIEPSKQAYDYSSKSLGMNIHNYFLNHETKNNTGSFDVIHMSEVLEHISNPVNMLEICHEKLNKDGLICIVVPNDYNPLQILLGEACDYESWWVAPPHHINYFNFNSLSKLLENTGFDIVLKESTFPLELFPLMGLNYVGDDMMGRKIHTMRKNFELNIANSKNNLLKKSIYSYFASQNIGREVVIIGRKK